MKNRSNIFQEENLPERDGEDRVVINMTVRNDSDFLSKYCGKNSYEINSEIADFLESAAENVNVCERLSLKVYGNCIDEKEKKLYETAIRKHYREKMRRCRTQIRKKTVLSAILLAIGIIILAISVAGEYFDLVMWTKITDIAAWVFIWEAVHVWAFQRGELRYKRKKYFAFS